MSEATPRVTAQYLESFSHQTVRILGKVRQLRGEQATIDAGGQIQVFLNRVSFLQNQRGLSIQDNRANRLAIGLTSPTQPRCRDYWEGAERSQREGYGFDRLRTGRQHRYVH